MYYFTNYLYSRWRRQFQGVQLQQFRISFVQNAYDICARSNWWPRDDIWSHSWCGALSYSALYERSNGSFVQRSPPTCQWTYWKTKAHQRLPFVLEYAIRHACFCVNEIQCIWVLTLCRLVIALSLQRHLLALHAIWQ